MNDEHVVWAYRLLLDREAAPEEIRDCVSQYPNVQTLRSVILQSPEFALKSGGNGAFSHSLKVFADLSPYGVDGSLYVNLSDYIGLSIANAWYEPEEVALVQSKVKPGQTFVDVGANVGFFSLLASHLVGPKGKVFTFEPVPETLSYLNKSISKNAFCSNVTVIEAIVTDRHSDDLEIAFQPLAEGSGSSGGSYLVSKGDLLPDHMHRKAVPADALVNFIPKGKRVDFIKIDVEGAEPLAMKGAESILVPQSPLIMSEVHPSQLQSVSKTDWRGYFDLMKGYGYTPFFFRGGELAEEARHLDDGQVYNVAFIKK
ncbi:hypothetical protein N185_08605 [Sinorhizobium sp. GW3]|nr:hypothetical protein N185_08605 [Sinorhizobium sp. GW3]